MRNLALKFRILEKYTTQCAFVRALVLAGINVNDDRLSRFISGKAIPTQMEIEVISQKLGCKPDELFPPAN